MHTLKQLFNKYKEIILYVFFGGLTTVVSVGSFIAFVELLGIHPLIANALSWILAVGFAYVTNRKWVFGSQTKGKSIWAEVCSFYGGRLMTLGLEEALLLIFGFWLGMNAKVVKLAAQVVVLISNYILSKFLIFRKK